MSGSQSQSSNEVERLDALWALDVLDTPPEEHFDTITHLASTICGTPIALITLIDTYRQWIKAQVGLPDVKETPREVAFCDHAIRESDLLEVRNAKLDPRFADNPLVVSAPFIRFYAGVPLELSDGAKVGALCVIDTQAKRLHWDQREALLDLARITVNALEARRAVAQEALLKRELAGALSRFQFLSDCSPYGVFVAGADGVCTHANAQWQAIHGHNSPRVGAIGNWSSEIHPDDREAVVKQWQLAVAQMRAFEMQYRVQRQDGSVTQVRTRVQADPAAKDEPTRYVGIVHELQ